MKFKNRDTILFTGDSITDCGRERPAGVNRELGDGYVSFVDTRLKTSCPDLSLDIINTGISGNRITDLEKRWKSDVLDFGPDWLSVLIGINDVWRQFDTMFDIGRVSLKKYEKTFRRLLNQIRPKLKGLILMSPYMIEPDRQNPMRKVMDEYTDIVRNLAPEFDALFVDLQAAFDKYLETRPARSISPDSIHPYTEGHMIIAGEFLKAAGF